MIIIYIYIILTKSRPELKHTSSQKHYFWSIKDLSKMVTDFSAFDLAMPSLFIFEIYCISVCVIHQPP